MFNWLKFPSSNELLLEKEGKIAELESLYKARNETVKALQDEVITVKREYFAKEKVLKMSIVC